MKKVLFLIFIFSLINYSGLFSQNKQIEICDDESLLTEIGEIVHDNYKIDSLYEMKFVLEIKIDSIGEVHSSHIRWSENLKIEKYYDINFRIESTFRVKFLFDRYRSLNNCEKYIYCKIPFTK